MMRLILLRHCETDPNDENKYLGSTDTALNRTGRLRAELIAEKFKNININKIYSSNLKRSYETANAIAKEQALKVEKLPGLNEINFGNWEGLTFDEITAVQKENAEEYVSRPSEFRFPGGETQKELNERVLNAFDKILKKHLDTNGTILMVSHAGPNRAILGKALNLPLKDQFRLKQDVGCVNVIDFFDDAAVVTLMNYTINSTNSWIFNPGKCVKSCEKCVKENCYSF